MPDIIETIGKCVNHIDKNLMVRVLDNAISTESDELRDIEKKKEELRSDPDALKRYLKIQPFRTLQHTTFKNNIEKLKTKILNTPECIEEIRITEA